MKDCFFDVEFYYRSSDPSHVRALMVLDQAGRSAPAGFRLRTINCDAPFVQLPDLLPAIPCLRRLSPRPERLIVGMLRTVGDVCESLGIPAAPQPRIAGLAKPKTRE